MHPRLSALAALRLTDPEQKVAATRATVALAATDSIATAPIRTEGDDLGVPGRPERPLRVAATAVQKRSPFTPEGRAALIHSICHIEFNAINLALDAVWRYDGMPEAYYRDWLRVADEEALHFTLLHAHLQDMGYRYGDFPGHDGLWNMCEKTKDDVLARMALVPRTLEARGLDATPLIQAKLKRVNTPDALRAVEILDVILRDEVGHVAIGNHWYRWLCDRAGIDPEAAYPGLVARYDAPRHKPPFNLEAILRAPTGQDGFGLVNFRQPNDADQIAYLDVWLRDLPPNRYYSVKYATDANVDGDCTSTDWVDLPRPHRPNPIHTDDRGTGRGSLFLDLSAFPVGSTFDIHFEVVDAFGGTIMLTSDCYQFTVTQ